MAEPPKGTPDIIENPGEFTTDGLFFLRCRTSRDPSRMRMARHPKLDAHYPRRRLRRRHPHTSQHPRHRHWRP